MTTGFGGMVLTDNEKIIERLLDLTKYDNREKLGESYNYKISDIQAALGLSQLKKLDEFVKRRKEIANKYGKMFKESEIDFSYPHEGGIFFRYLIKHENIDAFIENIKKRGVDAAKPVFKPLHTYMNLPDSQFPNTANAYKKAVSIPIYPSLNDEEAEDVAAVLLNWKENS